MSPHRPHVITPWLAPASALVVLLEPGALYAAGPSAAASAQPDEVSAISQAYLGVDDNYASLLNENTYFLFRDEFDHMQTPARLAGTSSHLLYTLVANQGGAAPRFSLGLTTPLGPGGLSVFLATAGSGSEYSSSDDVFDSDTGEVIGKGQVSSYIRDREITFYAGYGLTAGPVNLGLGTRIDLSTNEASTDEDLDYGGYNSSYEDLETGDIETVTGGYDGQNDRFKVLLSAGLTGDDGNVLFANLSLRRVVVGQTVTMEQHVDVENDPDESDDDEFLDYTVSGNATGYSLLDNATGLFVGLDVNPELWFNETFGMEGYGAIEFGRPELTNAEFHTELSSSTITQHQETNSTLVLNDSSWRDLTGWVAGRARISRAVQLRMGVGYRSQHLSSDLTDTETSSTTLGIGDSTSQTTSEIVASDVSEYWVRTLFAPVALQVGVNDKLALHLGAQYSMNSSETLETYRVVSYKIDDVEEDYNDEQSTTSVKGWYPAYNLSIGIEAHPAPPVRFGLMVRNHGDLSHTVSSSGSLALYGSARIEW